MRLTVGQVYRISIAVTVIFALLISVFSFFFLYRYLYKAITETEYLVSLQREYAIDPLKYSTYRQLIEQSDQRRKRQAPNWENANNPFQSY